jgi:hypothetical protein
LKMRHIATGLMPSVVSRYADDRDVDIDGSKVLGSSQSALVRYKSNYS